MQKYIVTGMSCAACAARVEKAVNSVAGVESCAVSLLTNSMGVEGMADAEAVIRAVTEAGYGASVAGEESLEDRETPKMKKRLFLSLAVLAVLMYVSMGHMMLGWPLPEMLAGNPALVGVTELVLTVAVMIINRKFFINGFQGLMHAAPNMDTLVAIGSGAAFVYSVYGLLKTIAGDGSYLHELYFESSAMILTLITVGKTLEARAKGKTTNALQSLMELAPKTAILMENGKEQEVPVSTVRAGNIFVVHPGSSIPVDGIVLEGNAAVDESALTGESIPVAKSEGDAVSAATVNRNGYLKCRATAVGEDTTLAQIIRLVSDAAETKAPIARTADRVAAVFVPVVMTIAGITALIWLLLGRGAGFALSRGISVLVISCPCALGLATPVAIMVASGVGAKNGILFKTAASIEETGRIQIAALDKTGTITEGKPAVTNVHPATGVPERHLLEAAYALEKKSAHPLAEAVTEYCEAYGLTECSDASDFEELPGKGLSAMWRGERIAAGNSGYIASFSPNTDEELEKTAERLRKEGKTVMFFLSGKKLLGVIAAADRIKEDSASAIKLLKEMNIRVIMLTGDNECAAQAIGAVAGVDEVIAGVLPDGKEKTVRELRKRGKTLMIGDGINDSPALACADIGMAIGAGADVAVDSADVVLIRGSLMDAANAVRLSRAGLKNIRENLFWAFFYNSIGIPVAAGVLSGWGITLSPMLAAACMSLSSFCVVSNALRLNLIKLEKPSCPAEITHRNVKAADGEKATVHTEESGRKETVMTERTLKVDGMMCPHCEARVVKAVKAVPGVEDAVASFEAGTVVIRCSADVAEENLVNAIEAQDYQVLK